MAVKQKTLDEQFETIDYELKYLQSEFEVFADRDILNSEDLREYLIKKAEQIKKVKEQIRLYHKISRKLHAGRVQTEKEAGGENLCTT